MQVGSGQSTIAAQLRREADALGSFIEQKQGGRNVVRMFTENPR